MEEMKATATPDMPEDADKSAANDAKAEKTEKKKYKANDQQNKQRGMYCTAHLGFVFCAEVSCYKRVYAA